MATSDVEALGQVRVREAIYYSHLQCQQVLVSIGSVCCCAEQHDKAVQQYAVVHKGVHCTFMCLHYGRDVTKQQIKSKLYRVGDTISRVYH